MAIFAHLQPGREKLAMPHSSELDIYGSVMIEHDMQVGELLKTLDDLKIEENTIVIYTTDNGGMVARWRDDAIPKREGHDMGRRGARAVSGSVAGENRQGRDFERNFGTHGRVHDTGRHRGSQRCGE